MKRNTDLLRRILLKAEAAPPGQPIRNIKIDGHSSKEVWEHLDLLIDEGLLDGQVIRDERGVPLSGTANRLTNAGHDFLLSARDDTVWNKVKNQLGESGLSVSIDVLKQMLLEAAKELVGIR